MGSPVLRIEVKAVPGGRFKVTAKVDGAARLERTVMATALPFYLQSLADMAIATESSRPIRPVVESPFEEASHG